MSAPNGAPGDEAEPQQRTGRKAERILLLAAGGYDVLLASLTLFLYSGWFRDAGYAALEQAGLLESSMSTVNEVGAVIDIYAAALLIIGVVTLLVGTVGLRRDSGRRVAEGSRKIIVWLAVCVVFSLATADFLGMLLYSVTLAVYGARTRALRKAA